MTGELQSLQQQLNAAIDRIARLEQRLGIEGAPRWRYLVARPHPWRSQLFLKGLNMTVGQLVSTMRANRHTPEQAAEDLDLPTEAIREALDYYEENRSLIQMEAAEERRYLAAKGYALEPANLPR